MSYKTRKRIARLLSIGSLAAFFLAFFSFMQVAFAADSVTADATGSINVQNWQVILGFLLPLATAVLLQQHWSSQLKAIVAFVFMVIVTSIGMFISGDFHDTHDWLTAVLAVFSASIVSYVGFWKPTGVAPTIERTTSV